jgi:hypothetical protein
MPLTFSQFNMWNCNEKHNSLQFYLNIFQIKQHYNDNFIIILVYLDQLISYGVEL